MPERRKIVGGMFVLTTVGLLLLVPPLVAFKGFPTRNVVKVTPEGLEFSRRRPVAFAELSSWGTDDYLKLVRPGLPTLLVSAADLPRRERLLREFEQALAAWQKRQPAGTQAARRTHFYGSTGGRLVGLSITALGAVSAIMALNLREPSISLAVVGGLVLAHAPLAPLKRVLGVFLIATVWWRRRRPPRPPGRESFAFVGAASGLGSALVGSVGPLTAPFFLAYGLTRGAYIGTEAASALTMHVTKLATYGVGDLLTAKIVVYGLALTPATVAGAWTGKVGAVRRAIRIYDRA